MASWGNLPLQYVNSIICIFGLNFGMSGVLAISVVPRMHSMSIPMIRENWHLVTNEPVEVQDCKKITDHFRGIYRT